MKLFKRKPKKTIKKYQVILTTNHQRYCINDIPTIEEAMKLIDGVVKTKTKWVRFGSFFFLITDMRDIRFDSYIEEVKK